jgi:DNA topoisomerase-3
MGKQLVLAEKPSVGRELARVLQCRKRERGFSEGDRYVVTWALGHLVELAQPAEYNERYKRWHMQDLPMLPAQLRQSIIKQTSDQYHVVENLLRREDIDSLVIATDAGREGELVARWIMKMAGWQKEVKRLWISSQTDSAIEQGFAKLKDGELYENLYAAAEARAAADWYVGMNVTRALTCRYDAKLSAGRVQTPTLALMTDREDEIEAFSGGFYWTIRADFGGFTASWQDESGSIRITEEQKSEAIIEKIKGKEGTIVSVDKLEKTEQPPLAYDLTELQRDANSQLSFSAKQTLDVLQGLYENHKIVTYPRTDSRYITPDIVPTLAGRLKAMDATPFGQVASLFVEHGYRSDMDRFVMESGVTDHHAIIPTEQRVDLNRLSKDERSLWELIALRFMEV